MQMLVASRGEPDRGWNRASIIVEQGVLREARALDSIRVFAEAGASARMIEDMKSQLLSTNSAKSELSKFYSQLHGTNPPQTSVMSDAERAASLKVPSNVAALDAYFANREKIPASASSKLHGLMASEVYNFVDGRRSYFDIYKAVYAEALAGGNWYYGTVTLEDVVALLDAAVNAKALTLK
jgi:hypothetical protein